MGDWKFQKFVERLEAVAELWSPLRDRVQQCLQRTCDYMWMEAIVSTPVQRDDVPACPNFGAVGIPSVVGQRMIRAPDRDLTCASKRHISLVIPRSSASPRASAHGTLII